ncbi:MAG: cobalt-precorrin 5A hydrolase, partial [Clostridia bacterium]|nr:cobalt-precorrin 5A hydrolase [Clostridia bacterium]
MKIAVICFTKNGIERAEELKKALPCYEMSFYTSKPVRPDFFRDELPGKDLYRRLFSESDALIFIGATGIAVRSIAPYVKDKTTDPAVISMDEKGQYVIPLLSGHMGGANELAMEIAELISAVPVVTTATDVNGKTAIDSFAKKNHMHISCMNTAKMVSAAVLERDIPVSSCFKINGMGKGFKSGFEGDLGVYIGYDMKEPYDITLRLVPEVLTVGIGCRRGTPAEKIKKAFFTVLDENGIDSFSVRELSSIDIKSDEEGLLSFAKEMNLPVTFYSAEVLNSISGSFTKSEFVEKTTGVDCVSERSCMMTSDEIIVKKTALDGVTIAVG